MAMIIWLVILELYVFIQRIQSFDELGERIRLSVPVDPHFTCKATNYRYLNLSKTIDYSRTYEDRMKIKHKIGLPNVFRGYSKFQIGPGVGLASAIRELPLNMMFSSHSFSLLEQSLFQMTSGGFYMNWGSQVMLSDQSDMAIKGSYLHMKPSSKITISRGDVTMKGIRAVLEEDSIIWIVVNSRLLLSHGNNNTAEAGTSVGLIMKRGSQLNIHLSSLVDIESGMASGLFMDALSSLNLTYNSKVSGGALVLMEKSKLCLDEQASIKIPSNGALLLLPNVLVTLENGKLIMESDEDSKSYKKLFCFIFKDLYLDGRIYVNSTTVDDSITCTNNPTEAYLKSLGNETDSQQREDLKAAIRRIVNDLPPFEASFEDPNPPRTDEWKSCSK